MYRSGMWSPEIGKLAGCDWKRIRDILVSRNVPLHKTGFPKKPWGIPVEEAHRRYLSGEPAESIAEAVGLHWTSVLTRFQHEGLKTRSKKESAQLRGLQKRVPVDAQQVQSLYESGLSMRAVAEEMQISQKVVWNNLHRLGVARRPNSSGGALHVSWKGGYTYDKHGYILVRRPEHPQANRSGYVRVHRLVMEEQVGRLLTREEVVDHKNTDTSDNHPDNLQLYATNAQHLRTTRTGSTQMSPAEREAQRRLAVQRARQRVAATLEALKNDAHWSHVAWPRPSTAPRTTPRAPLGTAPPMFAQRSSPEVSTPER